MFTTGLVIFASTLLVLVKLPRLWMLRVLHYDILIDVVVTAAVLAVHWGTFSGVMAATFAGLLTSIATSGAKRAFGHIRGDVYHPGLFHLDVRSKA